MRALFVTSELSSLADTLTAVKCRDKGFEVNARHPV